MIKGHTNIIVIIVIFLYNIILLVSEYRNRCIIENVFEYRAH